MSIRNHLIVFPTAETESELMRYMGGCPFDYKPPETWHVTLYVSQKEMPISILKPNTVYRAAGVKADLWYDSQLKRTNFVMVMESQDMVNRHSEIESVGIESTFVEYVPHLTLVYGFPEVTKSRKAFRNSLTMTLQRLGDSLMFTGESLIDSDGYTPNVAGQKWYGDRNK